jgi:hypothetical protein
MAKRAASRPKLKPPINVQGNVTISDAVTWSTMWTIGAKIVSSVVGLAALVTAWLYLGWWTPASRQEMVSEFMTYDRKVQPRIIEAQSLGLQNKLEILNLNKQSIDREKTDLEIKRQTIKDPNARAIINNRMNSIDSDARTTEKAIQDTRDALRSAK